MAFSSGMVAAEDGDNSKDPSVKISGLLQTEASYSSNKTAADTTKSSDTVLATVELHIDAKLNDMVSGHIMFLHEEDDTPLEIDEGIIIIGHEQGFSVSTGQMYLPFGAFETNMVNDPMTLEMGEIRESAVMATYASNGFTGSFYIFNGNIHKMDTIKLEQKGVSLSYQKDAINVGIDYISSVVDSEVLQENMFDSVNAVYRPIKNFVPGTAFHAIYRNDNFNLIVERVAALKKFDVSDGETGPGLNDGTLADKKPITTNFEFGYNLGEDTFAIALQGSKDAEGIFPKKKVLLGYSRSIFEKVGLGVEVAKTTDYDNNNTDRSVTAQLSIEF